MIRVAKAIKPPEKGRGRPSKYPWSKLGIGDSFFIPEYTGSPYSMLRSYNKSSGKKPIGITIRKENGGMRIWRIK